MKGSDIRNIIRQLSTELAAVYSDEVEAKSVVEILLMHHLNIGRFELYSTGVELLSEDIQFAINADFERLLKNEPIQYVIEKAWFAGLELHVGAGVLIPRPETEELVQWVVSNCIGFQNELEIIDIGTGSGCIALALKSFLPKALVKGLDISEDALNIARSNAKRLNLDIEFYYCDILKNNLPAKVRKRRIVVSNPPYVLESEKNEIASRVKDFEPEQALFVPNNNPLMFYERILNICKEGVESVYFEINPVFGDQLVNITLVDWKDVELRNDNSAKKRMIQVKRLNKL